MYKVINIQQKMDKWVQIGWNKNYVRLTVERINENKEGTQIKGKDEGENRKRER